MCSESAYEKSAGGGGGKRWGLEGGGGVLIRGCYCVSKNISCYLFVRISITQHFRFSLKTSLNVLRTLRKAMDAACCLKQAFRESPAVAEIFKTAVDAGVTEEQALMDVLFMLK